MTVSIRPLQKSDALTSFRWRNDSEVFKYTENTYAQEITVETEMKWIEKVINNPNDYRCAIIANGEYVGNVYLTDIDDKTANYHIFIGEKAFWGKGIARIASERIIEYAFNELKLDCIYLKVKTQNERAYRLYISLGFEDYSSDQEWKTMKLVRKCFSKK